MLGLRFFVFLQIINWRKYGSGFALVRKNPWNRVLFRNEK